MTELPIVAGENDWLELGDGDEAMLIARLDAIFRTGGLLLSFADWSQISVPVRGEDPFLETGMDRLRAEAVGRRIRLPVARTEDGIVVDAGAIVAAEILA